MIEFLLGVGSPAGVDVEVKLKSLLSGLHATDSESKSHSSHAGEFVFVCREDVPEHWDLVPKETTNGLKALLPIYEFGWSTVRSHPIGGVEDEVAPDLSAHELIFEVGDLLIAGPDVSALVVGGKVEPTSRCPVITNPLFTEGCDLLFQVSPRDIDLVVVPWKLGDVSEFGHLRGFFRGNTSHREVS